MAHTDPASLERVVKQIAETGSDIFIHIDKQGHLSGIFDYEHIKSLAKGAVIRIL